MAYNLRRSSHGGDRRHSRSLAETLAYGNDRHGDEGWAGNSPRLIESYDAGPVYDEAMGPPDMTRRPHSEEWGPRSEGVRFFETDQHMGDVMGTSKGKGKVTHTSWDSDPMTQYERYVDEENSENLGWGYV
jgi:hypothetical protein